jgi:hypothetical protein
MAAVRNSLCVGSGRGSRVRSRCAAEGRGPGRGHGVRALDDDRCHGETGTAASLSHGSGGSGVEDASWPTHSPNLYHSS